MSAAELAAEDHASNDNEGVRIMSSMTASPLKDATSFRDDRNYNADEVEHKDGMHHEETAGGVSESETDLSEKR